MELRAWFGRGGESLNQSLAGIEVVHPPSLFGGVATYGGFRGDSPQTLKTSHHAYVVIFEYFIDYWLSDVLESDGEEEIQYNKTGWDEAKTG